MPTRALVVDDDEHYRVMLARMLKRHFDDVETCSDGWEAWREVQADPARFQIVCADIRMPRMSGVDFLRKMTKRHSSIPVVLITGHGDFSQGIEAVQAGAFDFINKPFSHYEIERIAASLRPSGDADILVQEPGKIVVQSNRRSAQAATNYVRFSLSKALSELTDSPHLPFVALYEAIVNALVHGNFGLQELVSGADGVGQEQEISRLEQDPKYSSLPITVEYALGEEVLDLAVEHTGKSAPLESLSISPGIPGTPAKGLAFVAALADQISWDTARRKLLMRFELKRASNALS